MKDLILACDCIAKKTKPCGKLRIIHYGDGEAEVNGIILNNESVKTLINYLQGLNN